MAHVLRMPEVATGADTAVLSEWLVAEAEDFASADALATVETDKANVDVEADTDGRVLKALVSPGAEVAVGDPVAVLGEPGEQVEDLDALLASLGVAPADAVTSPPPDDSVAKVVDPTPTGEPQGHAPTGTRTGGRVFTSPLARKIAERAGLRVEQIVGTGPRGRVLRRDVEAAIAERRGSAAGGPGRDRPPVSGAEGSTHEDVPHTRARLASARRLTRSAQEAPQFSLRASVRAERLQSLRAEINEDTDIGVSLTDLVMKAVALAHRDVPDMNVSWAEEALRRYHTADVALAVATDHGLVTPVVRDVGSLHLTALAASRRDLTRRAQARRLRQEELEGGSITVSNLGMYDVEEFTAIVNPPHAAILAVGAVREEPVVLDGVVAPGAVLRVTLSVDHRPVDGALAARWLRRLVTLLERPVGLLV